MSDVFAPPEIFAAQALAAQDPRDYGFDGEPDLDLPRGVHLRIFAGMGQSWPLTPFAVHRMMSSPAEPAALGGTGAEIAGNEVRLDRREASIGVMPPPGPYDRVVRLDLEPQGSLKRAALIDQHGRQVHARDRAAWQFAAPVLQRVRMIGDGPVTVQLRSVNIDNILGLEFEGGRDVVLGLPVLHDDGSGEHAWYLAYGQPDGALRRVGEGAPLRLTPMDRADGDRSLANPQAAEVERVQALLAIDGNFVGRIRNMVAADVAPWQQRREAFTMAAGSGLSETSHVPVAAMLQIAALDPGVSRYMGFAARIDGVPRLAGPEGPGEPWDTLVAIGLFAIDPAHAARLGVDPRLDDGIGRHLLRMLIRALELRAGGRSVRSEVEGIIRRVQDQGIVVAPLVTCASAVLPPLAPRLPRPEILGHQWERPRAANTPSDRYRVGFAFPELEMATLAAVRRDDPTGPVPRHRMYDTPEVPGRAVPRLFGWEREPNSRHHALGHRTRVQRNAARLADAEVPADEGERPYRFAGSDVFGRFGPWTPPVPLGPPPRPLPPPPILQVHIERRSEWLDRDGPLSMGDVRIIVAVPAAGEPPFNAEEQLGLGSAILVPRVDEMPAGSLGILRLVLSIGGEERVVDATQPGLTTITVPLPETVPSMPEPEQVLRITGRFTDSDDRDGPEAELALRYIDLRPPPVHPTGIGLYWTSEPGPGPEVELELAWNGPAQGRYRVYLTDAVGLGLPRSPASNSRGAIAVDGCNLVRSGGATGVDRFRLLTPEPLVADAEGQARFSGRLPRSLHEVQFLRIVPVSAEGAEPDFARAPIVPVAVPTSRRPPPPLLDGSVDAATGTVVLIVRAEGIDLSALRAEEPGLFEQGAEGAMPPRFRIRRAVGPVSDPVYARVAGAGDLSLGTDGIFVAEWSNPPLEPFVRYLFWAEVQLPPERRGPAGVQLLTPENNIAPPAAAGRSDHPRPWSATSSPRLLMYLPPGPPPAPDRATAARSTTDDGTSILKVSLPEAPSAHSAAIGRWRLAAWLAAAGGDLEAAGGRDDAWPEIANGVVDFPLSAGQQAGPLTLVCAYVDPAERMGALATIPVP